jgi:hypothetical protein
MSSLISRRPLACALAALFLAAGGASLAQPSPAPAVPDVPPIPDIKALKEQAKELAKLHKFDERFLAALDEELAGLPASMAFIQNEFGNPREIIKNAPYSAEAVTESIQLLQDGNRIVRKSTTLLARDGAGRTRQERKDGGRSGVYIFDPMEGRSIVLNEQSRTVTRIPRMPSMPEPPVPPVQPVPPTSAAPPTPPAGAMSGTREVEIQPGRVIVKRRGEGNAEDVQVEVIRIARGEHDARMPPAPPLPPLMLPIVPRGKGETKSLGTKEFDGIKADGTMTSHTIPAGQIGNERPIVITSERWFSPELHIVVFAKTSDPRAGETIYRVTNVKRGEPSAELFKVPADYRNRGEGREREGREGRKS